MYTQDGSHESKNTENLEAGKGKETILTQSLSKEVKPGWYYT